MEFLRIVHWVLAPCVAAPEMSHDILIQVLCVWNHFSSLGAFGIPSVALVS